MEDDVGVQNTNDSTIISVLGLLNDTTIEEDCELYDLLKEWNLEKIYLTLRSAQVGKQELQYLEEKDLEKLFPNFETIGIKAKFRRLLRKWKIETCGENEANEPIPSAIKRVSQWINKMDNKSTKSSNSVSTEVDSFNDNVIQTMNLKDVLNQTPRGQDALAYFAANQTLSPNHQQHITNCVIDFLITTRKKLSLNDFDIISRMIVDFFPGENSETYFMKQRRDKKFKSSGKLYDRYYNLIRGKKKKMDSEVLPEEEEVEIDETLGITAKTWLKYNDHPLEEVVEKWKNSYGYRMQLLKKSEENNQVIENFLNEWPLYKNPDLSSTLIDSDFNKMYPGKNMNLLLKWESFLPTIIQFYKNNIKDKNSLELLSKLDNANINDNSRNFLVSILLNAVIIPSARYTSNNKKNNRVTIKEGMDSFVLHVKDDSLLEEEINELQQRFAIEHTTMQPFLVVVGSFTHQLSKFYLYLDGSKLMFSSFLSALDTCFKIFQIFNLKYPIYCSGVWLFIQKFYYEINTKYDHQHSGVNGFISHLKSFSNNN